MDKIHNSVLTMDELILLSSLEETDTEKALSELDNVIGFVPSDDESFPTILSLRDKLMNDYINISEELKALPDDEEPYFIGICDKDGKPVEGEVEYYEP